MLELFKEDGTSGLMLNRRMLYREPMQVAAVIKYPGRTIHCTTVDLSGGGAKLRVGLADLPARFEVSVPSRGLTRLARLIWQDADYLGVEFVGGA